MEYLSSHSGYSDLLPLDARFIVNHTHVSWPEIRWAQEKGLIGWRTVKQLAEVDLESGLSGDELSRLAVLTKDDASTSSDLVLSLAARRPAPDPMVVQKKWMYLLLKKLYDNKNHIADPYGLVEQIYADFDYPEELAGFIRWMPATEPVATLEEGASRMDRKWQKYLETAAIEFGQQSGAPH